MSSAFVPLNPADSTASALHAASDAGMIARADLLASVAARQWRDAPAYTICDAEFGAGWLFLALLRLWRAASTRPRRLHVVAVVERPYTRDALSSVLNRSVSSQSGQSEGTSVEFPANTEDDAAALLKQWPHVLPGQHRLSFEGGHVTLTLLFGSAQTVLSRAGFFADAFLWLTEPQEGDDRIVARMAALGRHARQGAWCVAGWRAQRLDAALRQSAFQRLTADEPAGVTLARRRADVPLRVMPVAPRESGDRHAVVIGGGLAASNVAYALTQRGWHVSLVCGASNPHHGHLAAALTPVLARDDNMRARLTRAGAQRAQAVWRDLDGGIVQRCGTVQLDRDQGRAGELAQTLAALQFAPGWVRAVDQVEASRLSGLPVARGGVFFSEGMLVRPDRLIDALSCAPGIVRIVGDAVSLRPSGSLWQVLDTRGAVLAEGSQVVVAAARNTPSILEASDLLTPLPMTTAMHALAGEITLLGDEGGRGSADVDDGSARAGQGRGLASGWGRGPRCVVGGEGYILPAVSGQVVVGSTYVRGAHRSEVTAAGQIVNLSKMAGLLAPGEAGPFLDDSSASTVPRYAGWAGWRAVVAGRLPVVGALSHAPGVSLAAGFGSRGLTWSALAGDMMAGALEGEPDVLETDLAHLIAPR